MKAIIMAGGEGTRLRPLTCNKPKPMVNVMGIPIMEYIIKLLKNYGITEIGVTLHYLPNEVSEYFNDGSNFGVEIEYFVEKDALGTAGGVKAAENFLNEEFIVISGDALTDLDILETLTFHKNQKSLATIVLCEVENPIEYGVVLTNKYGKIEKFVEKPDWKEVISKNVNTGIYVFDPKILSFIPENEFYDFGKDLFPKLIENNENIFGFSTDSYWCDIGDINAYRKCHTDIFNDKVDLSLSGLTERTRLKEFLNLKDNYDIEENIYIEENVIIEENVTFEGPVYIESGSKIFKGAKIGPETSIGKNTIVKSNASIKKSIIWNNCVIEDNCALRGSVLSSHVKMKENSHAYENSVIGKKSIINKNASIAPNVRVWPFKEVYEAVKVQQNLVWGNFESRVLFDDNKIIGEVNIDITPEFLSEIGMAFGSNFLGKIGIGVNCEFGNEMIKNSIVSGLLSTGCEVYDFGTESLAITRNATCFYELNGSINVNTFEKLDQKNLLEIKFIDNSGANITREEERKLEMIFLRGDF